MMAPLVAAGLFSWAKALAAPRKMSAAKTGRVQKAMRYYTSGFLRPSNRSIASASPHQDEADCARFLVRSLFGRHVIVPRPGGVMSGEANVPGPRVTLHVVSSLDGFIARKDNNVSWLDANGGVYEAGVSISEEEAAAFVKSIDCYVLGSRTYEHALELGWPYGDTPTVVLTGRKLLSTRKSVEFYSGDLKTLVDEKLAPRYRNVWLVGGALVSQRFLELSLVDEISLT